jgi:SAF domain
VTATAPAPSRTRTGRPSARPLPVRRRWRWSRISLGAVLVAACMFGFLAAASAVLGGRAEPVLEITQAVPAGAPLTAADLTAIDMRPVTGLAVIPASQQAAVTGRSAAVPLAPGSLLTQADLGPASYPPAGQAIVALPLAAGAWPPQMQPGSRVAIMDGYAGSSASGSASSQQSAAGSQVLTGTVTQIGPGPGGQGAQAIVTLLVDTASVPAIEQLTSPVLVVLDPGGTDVP